MQILYGDSLDIRYRAVADLIPEYSEVFEACAGNGRFFRTYLSSKQLRYQGCDLSRGFVRHAKRTNVPMECLDIRSDQLPQADIVVIQGSLYQFMPNQLIVLERLASCARRRLIIAEPIQNMATSPNAVLAWMGKHGATTEMGSHPFRFNELTLLDCISKIFAQDKIIESRVIGNDLLLCIDTTAERTA